MKSAGLVFLSFFILISKPAQTAIAQPFESDYLANLFENFAKRHSLKHAIPKSQPTARISPMVVQNCPDSAFAYWNNGVITTFRLALPDEAFLTDPTHLRLAWIAGEVLFRLSANDIAAARDVLFSNGATLFRNGLEVQPKTYAQFVPKNCAILTKYSFSSSNTIHSIQLELSGLSPFEIRFTGRKWTSISDVFAQTDSLLSKIQHIALGKFQVDPLSFQAHNIRKVSPTLLEMDLPSFPGFPQRIVQFQLDENKTWRPKSIPRNAVPYLRHLFPDSLKPSVSLPDTLFITVNGKTKTRFTLTGGAVSTFYAFALTSNQTLIREAQPTSKMNESVRLKSLILVLPAGKNWYHFWSATDMYLGQKWKTSELIWYPFIPKNE